MTHKKLIGSLALLGAFAAVLILGGLTVDWEKESGNAPCAGVPGHME